MVLFGQLLTLFMQCRVTELFVDPLSYVWYVFLQKLKRLRQSKASGILQNKHTTVVLIGLLWDFLK